MDTLESIEELAWERLEEAKILLDNGKYNGAFYLAGYSVELMLKANICRRLAVPNLFDTKDESTNSQSGVNELRKVLKTHNLHFLILLSGLKDKLDNDRAGSKIKMKVNSLLFSNWSEQIRYKPCGSIDEGGVKKLVDLLGDSDPEKGFLAWIKNN